MSSQFWRAGVGFINIPDEPASTEPMAGFPHWAPTGFVIPESIGAPRRDAPTPPVQPIFYPPTAPGYFLYAPPPIPAASPAPTQPTTVAPGLHLAGGLQPSHGYLFTGNQVTLKVVRGDPSGTRCPRDWVLSQFLKHGGAFPSSNYKTSSNTTVNQLIEALPGPPANPDYPAWIPPPNYSYVTQIFEGGDGKWSKGTTFAYKSADQKSESTLEKLGWGNSGDAGRPPIVLLLHQHPEV